MDPRARESVKRINTHIWTSRTNMICVKVNAQEASPPTPSVLGDPTFDRIEDCRECGSVWGIGKEAICKVKGWREDRQLEATTIAFVNEYCSSAPVPEVIYSWIDQPVNRTFLILRRVHGLILNNAWPLLSAIQCLNIANSIAQHCSVLASKISSRCETISGHGNLDYWLMAHPPASNPLMVLGLFVGTGMYAYMSTISNEPVPDSDEFLLFHHPDLGPTNIMVPQDGDKVAAIIDWQPVTSRASG